MKELAELLDNDEKKEVVKNTGLVGGPAAAGAVVGTFICPGVGSAIGAGVGGIVGATSLIVKTVKNKLKDK